MIKAKEPWVVIAHNMHGDCMYLEVSPASAYDLEINMAFAPDKEGLQFPQDLGAGVYLVDDLRDTSTNDIQSYSGRWRLLYKVPPIIVGEFSSDV